MPVPDAAARGHSKSSNRPPTASKIAGPPHSMQGVLIRYRIPVVNTVQLRLSVTLAATATMDRRAGR
jgi:hypothetical protein